MLYNQYNPHTIADLSYSAEFRGIHTLGLASGSWIYQVTCLNIHIEHYSITG